MVPFKAEFLVNTTEDANQDAPSIDALPGGGFVVVWDGQERPDQPFRGVLGQRFDAYGEKVGVEFLANTPTQNYQFTQGKGEVASHADGSFVVVWDNFYDQDGSLQGVFGQRFGAAGQKRGSEFQVNSYTTYSQYDSVVAVLGDGSFVVAWMDIGYFGAAGTNIFAQPFDADGNRVGVEFEVPLTTAGSPIIPAITKSSNDEFVVVWSARQEDGTGGVEAQRFKFPGARVGDEIRVDSYGFGNQRHPDVDGSTDGAFVVAWHSYDQDGDSRGIFAQRFDTSGEKIGAEFQVNTYTTGAQDRPAVAMDSDGSFVIVWTSDGQDASSRGVFGRRYFSDGRSDGDEFAVNTYTTGAQGGRLGEDIDVAVVTNGNIVVTWQSEFQDSDRESIIARMFCVEPRSTGIQCGDATCAGNGTGSVVSAIDALSALRSAIGLSECALCGCDTNDSGGVTATDALLILNYAVGLLVALDCPPCEQS